MVHSCALSCEAGAETTATHTLGTQQGHLGAAVPLPDFPSDCLTGRFWLSHGCSVGTGYLWAVHSKALELPYKGLLLHGHLCFRTLLLLSWESKNCPGSSCVPCELCLQPLLPSPAGWLELMVGNGWMSVLGSHAALCHALPGLCLPAIDLFLVIFWRSGHSCDCRDGSAAPGWCCSLTHTQTDTQL